MTEQDSQGTEESKGFLEEDFSEKFGEKHWGQKWKRDSLSGIIWAVILIWAGVAFLLWNLGVLDGLDLPREVEAWTLVLGGVGLILLVEVLVRLLVPAYSRSITGTLILGVILLAMSVGDFFDTSLFWPILLIAGGVVFLLRGVTRKK